jgi:hypothetical protein
MTKLFRLPLVPLGTHHAPQGPVKVTPERVDHWIKSFNRIKSAKNNIPIPWGHQLHAVPAGDADGTRLARAKYNAGFVERLEKNADGGLDVVGTVPPGWDVEEESGDLINPTDGCRLREMSAGIGNWKDGTGEVHRDIIVHAALCTLPVVAGQSGFTSTLSTEPNIFTATLDTDSVEYLYMLGTSEKAMKKDDAAPKDAGLDDLDMGAATGDLPPLPAPAAPAAPSLPIATPDSQLANDLIGLFAAVDAGLPQDTTPQNLLQNVKVTLTVLQSKGYKFCLPGADKPMAAESKIDTSTEGAQPEGMGPSMAYMSTEPDQTMTLSTGEAAYVEAWAQEKKEAYAKVWDKLQVAGLPEDVALQEKAHLGKCKVAIDPLTKRVSLPDAKSRIHLASNASGNRVEMQKALTAPKVTVAATLSTELEAAVPENVTSTGPKFDAKTHLADLARASGLALKPAA